MPVTRFLLLFAAAGLLAWPSTGRSEDISPAQIQEVIKDYIATHPDEIGAIAKDYLVKHPEFLKEVFIELAKRKQAVRGATQSKDTAMAAKSPRGHEEAIGKNADALFNSPHQVVLGNPTGNVTLVEFFDYSCGFCKRGLADLLALIASDPQLRVVLKELPILGPGSADAARVAIAVRMQDAEGSRELAFHKALLGKPGPASKETALAVARDLAFDIERIEQELDSVEVRQTLEETSRVAGALGIRGTPAYVIGDKVVFGAVGVKLLTNEIAVAHALKSK